MINGFVLEPLVDVVNVERFPGAGHVLSNLGQRRTVQVVHRGPRDVGRGRTVAAQLEDHRKAGRAGLLLEMKKKGKTPFQ